MIPLVDIHCHLLAGLDDGPRTNADALTMCRLARAEGIRWIAATAHQNDCWPNNSPERILTAVGRLREQLLQADIALGIAPNAEIMICPEVEARWLAGDLLSVAARGKYLLLELPHDTFVDLLDLCERLRQAGVRPILAHAERYPEVLHREGLVEELILAGCLIQVSAAGVTAPADAATARVLRGWCKRGLVHLLGSDGHSPCRRPPRMRDAYQQVRSWAGDALADRVGGMNGLAILQGLTPRVPHPAPARRSWLSRIW
jgi:protein-tyrosine phosphatase